MSYRELDIAHYLLYENVKELKEKDFPDEVFYGNSKFILDDGVVLDTCESKGKTLLYLTIRRKVCLAPPDRLFSMMLSPMRCEVGYYRYE